MICAWRLQHLAIVLIARVVGGKNIGRRGEEKNYHQYEDAEPCQPCREKPIEDRQTSAGRPLKEVSLLGRGRNHRRSHTASSLAVTDPRIDVGIEYVSQQVS